MGKYAVTYEKHLFETYYVEAKNQNEAEHKAAEKELNGEPDDEYTESAGVEVNRNDDYITE